VTDLASELQFARDLARAGGRIALEHFRRDPRAHLKSDGTWVTEADWAVEAQIRLRIARSYPDHNILGEEEGLTGAGGGPPAPDAPTWVIDPIDGTNNYIAGIPIWATLVGLRIEGTSVVGACHAPALGETYDAALGKGARCNGRPIAVDAVAELERATVFSAGLEAFLDLGLADFYTDLVGRVGRSRGFGDFWGHMLVARGAGHIMIEPELNLWDVAALEPIVAEAGGLVTGLNGEPWTSGPCITSCGPLHAPVMEMARQLVDRGS
jgi:histidinol-phosphatase